MVSNVFIHSCLLNKSYNTQYMTNRTFQTGVLGFAYFLAIQMWWKRLQKRQQIIFVISQPEQQKLAEETKTAESNETSSASTSLCHEEHNITCPYALLWNKYINFARSTNGYLGRGMFVFCATFKSWVENGIKVSKMWATYISTCDQLQKQH